MGKSTTSCFNIISCGGSDESVDRDDIDASSENKGPDKRGWSFRKRSARHRVLSNTVITETPLETKTTSEPVTVTSEPQVNSSISEKTHDSIWTEELPSITKDATVSTISTKPSCEDDSKPESVHDESDESAILVIQAAVRRFLAQRELVKHKNVVKLQAAVRGHLVRNHAVGTLRCVQAIVKMQALVRAKRTNLSSEINSDPKYVSMEKLLSNSLARQLLESTPKTKQINIKCVPSNSDSAWNWLERWMSVSSPETVESHTPEQNQDQEKAKNTENQVESVIPDCETTESQTQEQNQDQEKANETENLVESVIPDCETTESHAQEQNQDQEKANKTENQVESVFPECETTELEPKADEKENLVNTEEKSNERDHEEENSQSTNTQKPDDLLEDSMELVLENPVTETESKRVTKRLATDEADSEGRKSVFGSRKASNPSFIAAQSRFEELTSKNSNNNPSKSFKENDDFTPEDIITPSNQSKPVDNSSNQELTSKNSTLSESPPESPKHENDDFTPQDTTPSDPSKPIDNSSNQELTNPSNSPDSSKQENDDFTPEDITLKPVNNSSNEDNVVISSAPEESLLSECGTELSVTSTLDSPDQSEVETKNLPEESEVEQKKLPEEPELNTKNLSEESEKINNTNNSEEPNPTKYVAITEITPCDADIELVLDSDSAPPIPIPESSSPRSHITAPESQGTPNSQLSTNAKKTRSDNKKVSSSQKRKSWSTSKKSTVDSTLRASLENLPKDSKPEKRRNSFGSPRPENGDNGLIPNYMQATESARAKAIVNGSPRSSPDVQDKEVHLKKRHSLPGVVNGRQGSPRVQRSMSQALETAKGNGSQERKWQR